VDNKPKRGLAALSFATVLHDVSWEGTTSRGEPIPEKWKLFPGVLYPPFREKFFGAASTGSDASEWVRHEYRQDQLVRDFSSLPMLQSQFEDVFWGKDVFEHIRDGKWGSYHPANAADLSQNFSVFAFILSVVPGSSWPPKFPADGLTSQQMSQLGKNLMWFLDLATTQADIGSGPASLFLGYSLLGQALQHQFQLLSLPGLRTQWDASRSSRLSHSFAFLSDAHKLLAIVQQWFMSERLVYYASPPGSAVAHVTLLSPEIRNRQGTRSNLWDKWSAWKADVQSTYRDNYSHSYWLSETPPTWMVHTAIASHTQGEQTRREDRNRAPPAAAPPQKPKSSPAARAPKAKPPPAPPASDVIQPDECECPIFALTDSALASGRSPGGQFYICKKASRTETPMFGPAGGTRRHICFNFCTDPPGRCDGQYMRGSKGKKPCERLHLDFNLATYRDAPKEHFAEIHAWLKDPTVSKSFLPSDVFASSAQFQAL
jgi:hypothetical protein